MSDDDFRLDQMPADPDAYRRAYEEREAKIGLLPPKRARTDPFKNKPVSPRGLAARASQQRRIAMMHKAHGASEGNKCGHCVHFYRIRFANTYRKCDLYGTSGGPGTDWGFNWPACGKFEVTKNSPSVQPPSR
jgi:hypothetical protein